MAETWCITPEDRAKHDQQFLTLKPVGGMITGEQAKNFFMLSGLPPNVLGHIWSLADMNADGKMDQKEFSVAVFLIQKKLQGSELPKVLPPSLMGEPMAAAMPGGLMGGMGSMTMKPQSSAGIGIHASGFGPGMSATLPRGIGMANGAQTVMGFASAGGFGSPIGAIQGPQPRMPATSGEWAVPQTTKLKYTQMFNMQDRMKRGYLGGMEAREILTQSNLTHPVLAQIWNLSDLDNDGKLTCDEFVLAMHLVEQAKLGNMPPAKLPPDLIPTSYRRTRSSSVQGVGVMSPPSQAAAAPGVAPPQPGGMDAFGDLLGGLSMGATLPAPCATNGAAAAGDDAASILSQPVTFEDKRKENFDKGAAELEKRRQALRDMQQKENEERLAHERAEFEKREKIRLE